ncbi:uncharacterized protein LOC120628823 [Pararge aegeria]|uniref:uncharacterized protein LOC120628823 n=1 Tax=Pararge aegeria TaxID=116150 RepID=UPI0019D111E5|nr:uncharacterized protein LOC120628823 [Pararge aegeria]
MEDETNAYEEDMDTTEMRRKRNWEADNGEEWTQVNRTAKKKVRITENPQEDLILICVTESNAEIFLACKAFSGLEWRCQKTWEVGLSYGIVKNIENELTEEEIFKNIKCDIEIVSVKRLNRRDGDIWVPSDTVKVGFKGPSLPRYVYLLDLRIKVEKYIFPVTQCSRCWRFGHLNKFCPSNKIVCPKCTKNHANCETTSYLCSNCSGTHMALDKDCSVYKKEKKIREIMSEFNCSYRKAMSMFVPSSPPPLESYKESLTKQRVYAPVNEPDAFSYYDDNIHQEQEPCKANAESSTKQKKKKKKKRVLIAENVHADIECSSDSEGIEEKEGKEGEEENRRQEFKSCTKILELELSQNQQNSKIA